MNCESCEKPLTGGVDTFGGVGQNLCMGCWVDGREERVRRAKIDSLENRLEACRRGVRKAKEAFETAQADLYEWQEDLRVIEDLISALPVPKQRAAACLRQEELALVEA